SHFEPDRPDRLFVPVLEQRGPPGQPGRSPREPEPGSHRRRLRNRGPQCTLVPVPNVKLLGAGPQPRPRLPLLRVADPISGGRFSPPSEKLVEAFAKFGLQAAVGRLVVAAIHSQVILIDPPSGRVMGVLVS